jgi:hypothetical protein
MEGAGASSMQKAQHLPTHMLGPSSPPTDNIPTRSTPALLHQWEFRKSKNEGGFHSNLTLDSRKADMLSVRNKFNDVFEVSDCVCDESDVGDLGAFRDDIPVTRRLSGQVQLNFLRP